MTKKNVLITGVHGFLGNALREYFQAGWPSLKVYGVSRQETQDSRVFVCDLNDKNKLRSILARLSPHYIFHLAGGRLNNPAELHSLNYSTTVSLLKAVYSLKKRIHPRLIIPGTAAEYGMVDQGMKIHESMPTLPCSWYGFVKNLQTQISLMYAHKGLDVVVARIFNILGKGVPVELSIGRFCWDIAQIERGLKEPVVTTFNLDSRRDFLDVGDVSAALWKVARFGRRGEIYNVCSGHAYEIRELLQRLLAKSDFKGIKIREERAKAVQSFDCIGSNRKLKYLHRWKPQMPIEKSLTKSLDYYRRLVDQYCPCGS